jgi:hypothetical protein
MSTRKVGQHPTCTKAASYKISRFNQTATCFVDGKEPEPQIYADETDGGVGAPGQVISIHFHSAKENAGKAGMN